MGRKMWGDPFKVMFVCTGNSARSQMAEGFARHLGGGGIEAYSAGRATPCRPSWRTSPIPATHPQYDLRVVLQRQGYCFMSN